VPSQCPSPCVCVSNLLFMRHLNLILCSCACAGNLGHSARGDPRNHKHLLQRGGDARGHLPLNPGERFCVCIWCSTACFSLVSVLLADLRFPSSSLPPTPSPAVLPPISSTSKSHCFMLLATLSLTFVCFVLQMASLFAPPLQPQFACLCYKRCGRHLFQVSCKSPCSTS